MNSEPDNPEPDDSASASSVLRDINASVELELRQLSELPDDKKTDTQRRAREEERVIELELKGEKLEGVKQDRKERKRYAQLLFRLICAWLAAVFLLLLLKGQPWFDFGLSDAVLLAVVGGTTANVLGIFFIVANYLFSRTDKK